MHSAISQVPPWLQPQINLALQEDLLTATCLPWTGFTHRCNWEDCTATMHTQVKTLQDCTARCSILPACLTGTLLAGPCLLPCLPPLPPDHHTAASMGHTREGGLATLTVETPQERTPSTGDLPAGCLPTPYTPCTHTPLPLLPPCPFFHTLGSMDSGGSSQGTV